MTFSINMIDADAVAALLDKIRQEREDRMKGLLLIGPESLIGEQQFIAALDWVLDQATAKPDDDDDDEEREPLYGE